MNEKIKYIDVEELVSIENIDELLYLTEQIKKDAISLNKHLKQLNDSGLKYTFKTVEHSV